MIRVARPRSAAVVQTLAARGNDGLSEVERATWYHTGIPPVRPLPQTLQRPEKLGDFKAYKCEPVKQALERMFGGRCAYCESRYVPVSPMDVEHYRPKNGYLDEQGKLIPPGYYWLAAKWDNLLPSCIDCNRERKQARSRTGRVIRSKSGKGNKFPLAPGSPRMDSPTSRSREVPLLLDPCRDQPERHLQFELEGFVTPAKTREETELPKGVHTIDVCGLDRDGLVAERRAHSLHVRGAMMNICAWQRAVRESPGNPFFVEQLGQAERDLEQLLSAAPRYLALTNRLNEVFTEVRDAAATYHHALDAWTQAAGDVVRKAALEAAITAVKNLPSLRGPYSAFALGLLDRLALPAADAAPENLSDQAP